eukprot:3103858-Karenia_brevis.AAC.1
MGLQNNLLCDPPDAAVAKHPGLWQPALRRPAPCLHPLPRIARAWQLAPPALPVCAPPRCRK